jgi:putative drug exporter of the RND superfamily
MHIKQPAGAPIVERVAGWLPIDSTTSSIVLLVGMPVGIDCSLFYLRRVCEERAGSPAVRASSPARR